MIVFFAMLLAAWFQTHNDNVRPWLYAAILTAAFALLSLFGGGDVLHTAIVSAVMGLILWLYYFLLDYFSDNVILWWAILVVVPASMLVLPAWLMQATANV